MVKDTPNHTQIERQLRRNMTKAEKIFWFQVRNRRFENLKFKRQFPIPPYIVDFICEDHNLIIEIDGGQHNESETDQVRDKFLQDNGYKILRFWNNDVLNNIEGVMMKISNHLSIPSPRPSPKGEGALLIGEIKGAHGVKGLVRVAVYVENTGLFDAVKTHTITLKNKHKGDLWLAEVKGVTDKNGADALKGTRLYCDRSALPDLPYDEIYHADLIGMTCVDEEGNIIGIVESVENFGAGDVLEITPTNGGTSFYLSYDDKTVLKIDNTITVSMPEII
jgi:16S rRNA processing protein RimM